jgi:hypothetical protein
LLIGNSVQFDRMSDHCTNCWWHRVGLDFDDMIACVLSLLTYSRASMSTSGRRFLESKWCLFKLNDCKSKRPNFNMQSKISHQLADLVLICESQSNQRRWCSTWDQFLNLLTRLFWSIIGC